MAFEEEKNTYTIWNITEALNMQIPNTFMKPGNIEVKNFPRTSKGSAHIIYWLRVRFHEIYKLDGKEANYNQWPFANKTKKNRLYVKDKYIIWNTDCFDNR